MTTFSHIQSLFEVRRKSASNYFLRPNLDKILRWVLILFLGGLFLFGDYVFFFRVIRYLDELPLQVGEELIVQMLNVVFLTIFIMVLFSSLISSLSIFYMSSDLDFLHSLPMHEQAIITVKFWQNCVQSCWMVFLFSLPMFIAYGIYFDVTFSYYLYLITSLLPFVLIPCVLGSLGIMALMRYFPTKKAHQILSILSLLFLIGIVVYLRFLSPEKFFDKQVSDEMIMAFVDSLKVPDYEFLPSSWITIGLNQWIEGHWKKGLIQEAWLWTASLSLLGIFAFISNRIYYLSWCHYQEIKTAPVNKPTISKNRRSWQSRLPLSPAFRALLTKDVKIFFRDPSQWSQLFILFALVVVYIFNILNLPLKNLVLKNVVSVLNIGLVGFVLAALISRFVFASTSAEGKKFWAVYSSPMDMKKFLIGKFLLYFPPLLFLSELLVVVSNWILQVDPYVMTVSVIGIFLITTGLVGLGTGLGAMYPMFDHENVPEISTSTGGIIFMIQSLIYVGSVLVLTAYPMHVHFTQRFLLKNIGGFGVPVSYGLIILLTVFVTVVPFRRGVRKLQTMDL